MGTREAREASAQLLDPGSTSLRGGSMVDVGS